MRLSVIFAVLLAVGAVAWIASGMLTEAPDQPVETQTSSEEEAPQTPFEVRVADIVAEPFVEEVELLGHTEANRIVDVAAEIDATVTEVLVEEGMRVEAGEILIRLAVEDLQAQVDQAEALVQQRQIEFNAAAQLGESGYSARTSVATARANLNAAQAQLETSRQLLSKTEVAAPFAGVVNDRAVELGGYVRAGDPVATIVDLDPLVIVANVSEQQVAEVQVGAVAHATIVGNTAVEGVIRYVSAIADTATRTFRVEIEIANPNGRIVSGLTADVQVPGRQVLAHLISPAVITLADDGAIGVRIVNAENIVEFMPITLLDDTADGLWVAGLPESVTLITIGQEYVSAGQTVTPVYQPSGPPYDRGDAAS